MKTLTLNGRELKFLLHTIEYIVPANKVRDIKSYTSILNKIRKALTPIKVSSRKGKGRKLQQQVCKDIAAVLNIKYDQQDDNCPVHSREMGQQGRDIILRHNAQANFPFCIECKSAENLHLDKAIEQVKKNMNKQDKGFLIVHKKRNKNILVTLEWKLFLLLYGDLLDYYNP